ncbi:MAG: hypothetical protein KGL51_14065 [Betaproteobacteria bacterium]|nr:hypothetical protein [Betaproteobacteria bacterium]MDE2123862.1 hypothetical protein [Betaproteobacteria bacterium]MDE2186064.1 hypothetical protein [Betaproteobacteria bacterium]MDE2325776.1 hypothetical protein [Betaproteobacteria bacterium]
MTLDSLSNASNTVPVAGITTLMSNGPAQYADASVIYNLSNNLYQVVGHRNFFYASAGQVYRMDLTASSPQPTQMGTLGLTQLCSLTAHESEITGQSGDVLVTGLTTTGATPAGCSGTSVQAWAIPFGSTATSTITPLGFVPSVLGTYRSGSNVADYLTQVGGSLYVTANLGQQGTQVSGLSLTPGSQQAYSLGVGGSDTLHYVQVYTNTAGSGSTPPSTTFALYSVTSAGVAQQITGLPSNSYFQASADSSGNLYIANAVPTTTSSGTTYAVQIFKVTVGQSAATLLATINAGSDGLNGFQVNATGTGGLMELYSTTSPPTNTASVVDFATQTSTLIAGINASSVSFQGIGLDGNAILQGGSYSSTGTSSGTIWSVNPTTGAIVHTLANQQFDGGLGDAFPADYSSQIVYGSLLTQAPYSASSTGTCSPIASVQVVETQNYSPTGQFAPPTGSCGVYASGNLLQTSGQSYVIGTSYGASSASGSANSLIGANPQAAVGATATVLGANSSFVRWAVPF